MDQGRNARFPVKGKLTIPYILSLLIAVLVAAVSIIGLGFRTHVYPTRVLIRAFVPNDAVNLLIELPILLVSILLARRGKWIGLPGWTGALFFVFYKY